MGTNQKLTAKQKAERIKAAQEREAREKARREAAARTKKIPNAASRAELFCKGSAREGGRGVCVTMNGCRAQA